MCAGLLTENHEDSFHQVDNGLAVLHLRVVLRRVLALVSDVDEDTNVHGYHDEEGEQVQNCPEDQETAAVKGGDGGAILQMALTVPHHGGHHAHDDAHRPDADYQQHNPTLTHLAVQLHGEDGLVALDGDSQQVGYRRRQADVNQGPADIPLILCQHAGPGARV